MAVCQGAGAQNRMAGGEGGGGGGGRQSSRGGGRGELGGGGGAVRGEARERGEGGGGRGGREGGVPDVDGASVSLVLPHAQELCVSARARACVRACAFVRVCEKAPSLGFVGGRPRHQPRQSSTRARIQTVGGALSTSHLHSFSRPYIDSWRRVSRVRAHFLRRRRRGS